MKGPLICGAAGRGLNFRLAKMAFFVVKVTQKCVLRFRFGFFIVYTITGCYILHTLQYITIAENQKRTTCTNSVNHEGEMCTVIKEA